MGADQLVQVSRWALVMMVLTCRSPHGFARAAEPSSMSVMSPLSTLPAVRSMTSAHNDQVCSTWGNFHFKNFDGDVFRFPGTCNYVYSSHCKSHYEDFNIQIRRSLVDRVPTITRISMKVDGVVIEMDNSSIVVDGKPVHQLPSSHSRVLIEKDNANTKVTAKIGLVLKWHKGDDNSLLLELDKKYVNQTCGLCGDFNGIPRYSEFVKDDIQLTPTQFGNLQKLDGPTEQCEDPPPVEHNNCTDLEHMCTTIWSDPAFDKCQSLVGSNPYIEACNQDMCHCVGEALAFCLCTTVTEYSRQCTHAGGRPQNWRRNDLCYKECPETMQYRECGSPCANACTNQERTELCEDHCVNGCFCPQGTVLDDIEHRGCIPHQQCSCTYNGKTYKPGMFYNVPCRNCTCVSGQWSCVDIPCPGTCFIEGGSHITSYDETRYRFHGDCSYVLSKSCKDSMFTVLGELRKCGLTDSETCLKSVHLQLDGGHTIIVIKPDGSVFVNSIHTRPPMSAANVTIIQPSSFFIIVRYLGLQLQVQLKPIMQLFISLDLSFQGKTCGLCGNYNDIQADDFTAVSGVLEGSAAAFANTWKTTADCPNVKNIFEDPCTLSIENEKYAQHWCALLTDSAGPFSQCHGVLNPTLYYANCMFDTCNCQKSEDCLCASLSSYVRACAFKGIILTDWRVDICTKYSSNCPESQTYRYNIDRCQATCRSRSERDITSSINFVPVDGCTCQDGALMDDAGKCVPLDACPCYYKMSAISSGEVIRESGIMCTCTQGKLSCIGEHNKDPVCVAPMVYFNCTHATVGTRGSECQKSCQTLDMECYSTQCVSGCMCPQGLVSDDRGGCIHEDSCPCIHNEEPYRSGEKIQISCNTCTCNKRMWQCTNHICLGTCVVYGDGHYATFDGKHFGFNGNCEYTLVKNNCEGSSSESNYTNDNHFQVVTENIPCGTTGTTCSKALKVFMGQHEMILSDRHFSVVQRTPGTDMPYKIRHMGIYMAVECTNGLSLIWDKKTSVMIKISSNFKGRLCGLCGNYDGNSKNDFSTRSHAVVGDVTEFGNSWKFSSTCPDVGFPNDPCSANPYRKSWAQKQCSIITSDTFTSCHSQISPQMYYEDCVRDACACDTGGDCECFCTAVAAYAQACSEAGVCVHWRSPTICPLFCDYYNPEGECEWHYMPCGAPCLRTCSNPEGKCLRELPGLEGCYPRCPPEKPLFNEVKMKCVAKCGCYDMDENFYEIGQTFWPRENCHVCKCTESGIECKYQDEACLCVVKGIIYKYKELISHTQDGMGGCIDITCGANGPTDTRIFPCPEFRLVPAITLPTSTFSSTRMTGSKPSPTIKTPSSSYRTIITTSMVTEGSTLSSTSFTTSYPTTTSTSVTSFTPTSVSPSPSPAGTYSSTSFTTSYPTTTSTSVTSFAPTSGSTLSPPPASTRPSTSIRNSETSSAIKTPSSPSHTTSFTSSTLSLGSTPRSTSSTSRFPSTASTPVIPRSSSSGSSAAPCEIKCHWTQWFDDDYPTSEETGGDKETYARIEAAGHTVCEQHEKMSDIACEAEKYPHVPLADLMQVVACDVSSGLECKNEEQNGPHKMCLNYRIKVRCCEVSSSCHTTTSSVATVSTSRFTPSTTESVHTVFTSQQPLTSPGPNAPAVTPTRTSFQTGTTLSHPSANTLPLTSILISKSSSAIKPPSSSNYTTRITTSVVMEGSTPSSTSFPTSYPTATSSSVTSFAPTSGSTLSPPPASTRPSTSIRNSETSSAIKTPSSPSHTTSFTSSTLSLGGTPRSTSSTSRFPSTASTPVIPNPPSSGSSAAPCEIKCHWTQWFDDDYPTSEETGGDKETYARIEAAGHTVCEQHEKMSDIACEAEKYPHMPLADLMQVVACDVSSGLECKNEDQNGPHKMCLNYRIKVRCCEVSSGCHTTTSSVATVSTSSFTPYTTESVHTVFTSQQPLTSPGPNAPSVTPTRTSFQTETTLSHPSANTLPSTSILSSKSSAAIKPPSSSNYTTHITTSMSTISRIPSSTNFTSSYPTTTSTPVTSIAPTIGEISPSPTIFKSPATESVHKELTSKPPTLSTGSTIPSVTQTQTPWESTRFPETTRSLHTNTSKIPITPRAEESRTSAATTITPAQCFCMMNDTAYYPGEVLYDYTDDAGCGVYVTCGDDCRFQKYLASCPPTCNHLDPPREVNEVWMINNCAQGVCLGNNTIKIDTVKCPPVEQVSCGYDLLPKQVFNDGGCCFHYECESCTGPDGKPKMPGMTWTSNCQQCTCDAKTITVNCTPLECTKPAAPICDQEGFELVETLMPYNPCCTTMQCRCNHLLCKNNTETCPAGYMAVVNHVEGDCCPTFACEPDQVCVFNETTYQPGWSVRMPKGSCEECMCTRAKDAKTRLNQIFCMEMICQTQCPQGFEYQPKDEHCCGECVQVSCIVKTARISHTIKPEQKWSPPGMPCVSYQCTKDNTTGHFVLITENRTCPVYRPDDCSPEDLTEIQYNECCKLYVCMGVSSCKVHVQETRIQHGDCWTTAELSYCEGGCSSLSMFSNMKGAMDHKCTCCQELKTSKKTVQLDCADGTRQDYTYITVDDCGCTEAVCIEQ